nr:hypothetical protein [Micromonospora saelicesensis]
MDSTPADDAPVAATPADSAPADTTPADDAPASVGASDDAETRATAIEPAEAQTIAEPMHSDPVNAEPAQAESAVDAAEAERSAVAAPPVRPTAAATPPVRSAADTTISSVDADPTGPADDFRRIQGIGPKMAAALQDAGVRTYGQLGELDEPALRDLIRAAGLRAAPGLASWPQQARVLAGAGDEMAAVLPGGNQA